MKLRATALLRLGFCSCLGALLLLPGACGSGEGGGSFIQLVGGILKPNAEAYELTQTSADAVGVGDLPDVDGIPSSVDLRRAGILPPVRNQRWNSCVAWTLAYYLMSAIEAKRLIETDPLSAVDMTDSDHWFAPDYIYSQRDADTTTRELLNENTVCRETDGDIGCMRPEQALKILVEGGCAKWSWMCSPDPVNAYRPCDPAVKGLENLRSRRAWGPARPGAEMFKPPCYVRFGKLDDGCGCTIRDMQAWLHRQGTPIAIVVKMKEGWLTYRGENRVKAVIDECFACDVTEERGVCLDAGGDDLGSQHMMTIIGYDDNWPNVKHFPDLPPEKRGSFLVVNQWGDKWGADGYMWIPYSELNEIWVAGYGLVAEPPPQQLPPPDGQDADAVPAAGGGDDILVCSQDLYGRWPENVLFEPDDVPENLFPFDQADVPGVVQITATEMDFGVAYDDEIGAVVGGVRDNADWFTFETTEANQTARFCFCYFPNQLAPLSFRITDREQRTIAVFRDAPFTPPNRHVWQSLCEPGRYFVQVTTQRPGTSRAYGLRLVELLDGGPGSNTCSALPLALDVPETDQVDSWWKFTAATSGTYDVTLTSGFAQLDAWRGNDPDRLTFVSSVEAGSASTIARISIPAVAGECLYFQGLAKGDLGSYDLLIEQAVAAPPGNTPGAAVELTPTVPVPPTEVEDAKTWVARASGNVDIAGNRTDYYCVRAPAWTDVKVRVLSSDPGEQVNVTVAVEGEAAQDIQATFGPEADNEPEALEITVRARPRCPKILIAIDAGPDANTRYDLAVEFEFDENPDRDGTARGSIDLALGVPRAAMLDANDTADWFCYFPREAGEVIFVITDFCAELKLEVFDEAGTPVKDPLDDAGSSPVALFKRVKFEANGSCFIKVSAVEGTPTTAYTLRAARVAAPRGTPDDDTPATGAELALGVPRPDNRVGGQGDAQDFFHVTVDQAGAVTFAVSQSTSDLRLRVSDDAGKVCANADDCTGIGQVTIPNVPAGTVLRLMVELVVPTGDASPYTVQATAGP